MFGDLFGRLLALKRGDPAASLHAPVTKLMSDIVPAGRFDYCLHSDVLGVVTRVRSGGSLPRTHNIEDVPPVVDFRRRSGDR